MTKISELVALLTAIEMQYGDIPVRYLKSVEDGYPEYKDVEFCDFATDKDEPQTSDNPYADGFVVIE